MKRFLVWYLAFGCTVILVTSCTGGKLDPNPGKRIADDVRCLTVLSVQGLGVYQQSDTAAILAAIANASSNPAVAEACEAMFANLSKDVSGGLAKAKAPTGR